MVLCVSCKLKKRRTNLGLIYKRVENIWTPRKGAVLKILTSEMDVKKDKRGVYNGRERVLGILIYLSREEMTFSERRAKANGLFENVKGKDSDWYARSGIKRKAQNGWHCGEFVNNQTKSCSTVSRSVMPCLQEHEYFTSLSDVTLKMDIPKLESHKFIKQRFAVFASDGRILELKASMDDMPEYKTDLRIDKRDKERKRNIISQGVYKGKEILPVWSITANGMLGVLQFMELQRYEK